MKVILAKNSGFCFGVKRAIQTTLNELEKDNNKIYSLGPLIHNNQVINILKEKGLMVINDINDIRNAKLIIRSHGVPLSIYENAKKNSIQIIDTTCPFVRNIQKKVNKYYKKGYVIVIIGNPNHPEVIGINGWCKSLAYVINSKDDIEHIPKCDKICIVAQTTMTKELFDELSNLVTDKANDVLIFNTICNATKVRQESCREIAEKSDAMVVIGGYHSSNTQKLYKISKNFCKNTYHIETFQELPMKEIKKFNTIGVTAGASTPECIIREVINKMNNNENEMNKMMEEIEKTMVKLKTGDIVKGKVISINENEVMVNVGYKSDGIITKEQFSNEHNINLNEIVQIGDEFEVYVVSLNDGEGNVILSKKKADSVKNFIKLEEKFENQEVVQARITEVVKGGLIAYVMGIKAFIPASHVSANYVKDLSAYLEKELDVNIIEYDKRKRRVILSRKEIEKKKIEQKKKELLDSLEIGMKIEGKVKRLTNFGAFVDIGGMDGLIHISELSWGRIKHPSQIVKEDDTVEVVVLNFDKDKEKISLGLKQTKPHPWDKAYEKYNIGKIIEGKVARLVDFGAFVELEPGLDGLVHISQISENHIAKSSDVLEIGQIVKVKILDIKEEEQRISLSIKDAKINKEDVIEYLNEDEEDITIGDILNKKN